MEYHQSLRDFGCFFTETEGQTISVGVGEVSPASTVIYQEQQEFPPLFPAEPTPKIQLSHQAPPLAYFY
jgi:hypothetical protein